MDIHSVPGVKARDVAEAHRKDLMHQQEYGCNCMTYWIDEERESIFCLIEAETGDAVKEMHHHAHGLVPHKIIEVSSALVQSFLGRIYDPEHAISEEGLKVFADPAFRLLLVTATDDFVLLRQAHAAGKVDDLLSRLSNIVRKNIRAFNGSEAEHEGEGFVVSFVSASNALSCALAIRNEVSREDAEIMGFRMAVNGGEPIEKSNQLFGYTIRRGQYLCTLISPAKVALAGKIQNLVSRELLLDNKEHVHSLTLPDEDLVMALFARMEENFHDPAFDISSFASSLSMSQPQFYRKTMALTGLSGNNLLKEFRLNRAKELLKSMRYSVSQVTFDTGFSSPSYFTKCFKTRYGLLPGEYLELSKKTSTF